MVDTSRNSVVLLWLRGRTDRHTTFTDVLARAAQSLMAVGSKLVIVSANHRVLELLGSSGVAELVGEENIYVGDERVGTTVKRAYGEALDWVADRRSTGSSGET